MLQNNINFTNSISLNYRSLFLLNTIGNTEKILYVTLVLMKTLKI